MSCVEQKPWKKEGKRWRVINEPRVERRKLPRHDLVRSRNVLKCKNCPQVARTDQAKKRLKSMPCGGSVLRKASAYARKRGRWEDTEGHLLCISGELRGQVGEGVVWCAVCGAYASKVTRNLVKKCPGVPTRAGQRAIACFKGNRHPQGKHRLHAPVPFMPEGLSAWEEGLGRGVEEVEDWYEVGWGGGQGAGEEMLEEPRHYGGEEGFAEPPDQEYELWVLEGLGANGCQAVEGVQAQGGSNMRAAGPSGWQGEVQEAHEGRGATGAVDKGKEIVAREVHRSGRYSVGGASASGGQSEAGAGHGTQGQEGRIEGDRRQEGYGYTRGGEERKRKQEEVREGHNSGVVKPHTFTLNGIDIGDCTGGYVHKTGSHKRSRFRF